MNSSSRFWPIPSTLIAIGWSSVDISRRSSIGIVCMIASPIDIGRTIIGPGRILTGLVNFFKKFNKNRNIILLKIWLDFKVHHKIASRVIPTIVIGSMVSCGCQALLGLKSQPSSFGFNTQKPWVFGVWRQHHSFNLWIRYFLLGQGEKCFSLGIIYSKTTNIASLILELMWKKKEERVDVEGERGARWTPTDSAIIWMQFFLD